MDFDQSVAKVRRIEARGADASVGPGRLRNSWFGRACSRRLRQYASVAKWLRRSGYPFYINLTASLLGPRPGSQWRPLRRLSQFVEQRGLSAMPLVAAATVDTPPPRVFPSADQAYLGDLPASAEFPGIFVAPIEDALVYGGTNLVLADGQVLCHDLYRFASDFTSEETHFRVVIDPRASRIRWLVHDHDAQTLPVAASFVDACAPNYAHWLTEVLPRLALFCADSRFAGIPIVVNDGLHENIMQSVFLVADSEREIITLPIGRALRVERLYLTSVTGYVPYEPRRSKAGNRSHGLFSPQALTVMRETLGARLGADTGPAPPGKVYLRRNSGVRRLANGDAIEALLRSRGYAVVEPEKLSFAEQVRLFANAEVIIGSTGAALANAVFCRPGARVAILLSRHPQLLYGYWGNLLHPIGVQVSYLLGGIIESHGDDFHGDFVIEPAMVTEFLQLTEQT